jgi:hypothetical protein
MKGFFLLLSGFLLVQSVHADEFDRRRESRLNAEEQAGDARLQAEFRLGRANIAKALRIELNQPQAIITYKKAPIGAYEGQFFVNGGEIICKMPHYGWGITCIDGSGEIIAGLSSEQVDHLTGANRKAPRNKEFEKLFGVNN